MTRVNECCISRSFVNNENYTPSKKGILLTIGLIAIGAIAAFIGAVMIFAAYETLPFALMCFSPLGSVGIGIGILGLGSGLFLSGIALLITQVLSYNKKNSLIIIETHNYAPIHEETPVSQDPIEGDLPACPILSKKEAFINLEHLLPSLLSLTPQIQPGQYAFDKTRGIYFGLSPEIISNVTLFSKREWVYIATPNLEKEIQKEHSLYTPQTLESL